MIPAFSAKRMLTNIVLAACIGGMIMLSEPIWRAGCAIALIVVLQIRDIILITELSKPGKKR